MTPKTPMTDIRIHNSSQDEIVRRLNFPEWRKQMNFKPTKKKTEEQIALDVRQSATVRDIRDNRDPGYLGKLIIYQHGKHPELPTSEIADRVYGFEVSDEFE